MVSETDMRAEITALRAEVDALKAAGSKSEESSARKPTDEHGDVEPSPVASLSLPIPEDLRDLEQAVRELAETVESDIAEHPVVSVGAAFLLGVLIGRMSTR